jgi:hypothetical protein
MPKPQLPCKPRKAQLLGTLCLAALGLAPLTTHALSSEQERDLVQQAMKQYSQSYGGRVAMRELDSMRITGTYHQRDRSWPFVMFKYAPDKARLVVKQNTGQYTRIHDGETTFRRYPFEIHLKAFEGIEAAQFRLIGALFSPLWEAFETGRQSIAYSGEVDLPEGTCHILSLQTDAHGLLHSYFHTGTGKLLKTVQHVKHPETGEAKSRETRFEDYQQVQGIEFPSVIRVLVENRELERYEIETVETDIGILPTVFEVKDVAGP